MISELYQKTILKYAANATAHGAIEHADHSLTVHNPMCGDRIKVYIKLDGKRLQTFSHEAKACALCQASASLLGEHYQNLTEESLSNLIALLRKSLSEKQEGAQNEWPNQKWQALDIFNVVREHKSRQTCVTLPFDALLQAMTEANQS